MRCAQSPFYALFLLMIGCGSDDAASVADAADTGAADTATADTGVRPDTGAIGDTKTGEAEAGSVEGCADDIANDAPVVVPTKSSDAYPTPAGGTITPGTYHVTAYTVYKTTPLPPFTKLRQTFRVTSTELANRELYVEPMMEDHSTSATYTVSGTSLDFSDACSAYDRYGFTATDTTITLICRAPAACTYTITLTKK